MPPFFRSSHRYEATPGDRAQSPCGAWARACLISSAWGYLGASFRVNSRRRVWPGSASGRKYLSWALRSCTEKQKHGPWSEIRAKARPNGSALTLEKNRWRKLKSFAQFLYVGFVEVTFLVQDFGYDAFRTKDWDQILLAETIGIHQCAEDIHRGSIGNEMTVFFVCFDQSPQDFSVLLFFTRWIIFACQRRFSAEPISSIAGGCRRDTPCSPTSRPRTECTPSSWRSCDAGRTHSGSSLARLCGGPRTAEPWSWASCPHRNTISSKLFPPTFVLCGNGEWLNGASL